MFAKIRKCIKTSRTTMQKRIDEILVQNHITTYRRSRRFLQTHEVYVDKKRILNCSYLINTCHDKILIDGKEIEINQEIYIMLNKKAGTVCSTVEDSIYPTVYENIPYQNLHSIGRLDADTEGLLILTTDGKFSHRIANPAFHVPKTYFIKLKEPFNIQKQNECIQKCRQGFFIPHERAEPSFTAEPSELKWISENTCQLTITEGKFHQVKRMMKELGNEVEYLKRISMGKLKLDPELKCGEYRLLKDEELNL